MGYGVAWEAMRGEHGAEFEDRTVGQSDDVRRRQVGVADKLVSQCNGQLESAADRRAIVGQRKTDGFERPRRRLENARKVYNRIAEPKMLLWLAAAAGVSADRVEQAKAAEQAEPRFMSKCGAVRKVLPWELVGNALISNSSQRAGREESSPQSPAEVSPLEIEALLLQTAKRWNIPADLAKEVIRRDSVCIYCRQSFVGPTGAARRRASWEHIVNDVSLISLSNIGLCCVGCNGSKGTLPLGLWLGSDYCQRRSITKATISPIAARAVDAN